MTNDGLDAISGCPVWMSGRIVFRTHSLDFTVSYPFGPFYGLEIVFKGPVHRTEKKTETGLNRTD
jgi:hypothetical protein